MIKIPTYQLQDVYKRWKKLEPTGVEKVDQAREYYIDLLRKELQERGALPDNPGLKEGEARRVLVLPEEERGISPAAVIAGAVGLGFAAMVGLFALAQAAVPLGYLKLYPDRFYYLIYTDPSKTFKAALGECYPVIYTIDVYDPETDDYWPPADPEHDILETGSECRVMVQETCTLCGFELP